MSVGLISVICGPMFSGKTTRLLDDYERSYFSSSRASVIFRPSVDTRAPEGKVSDHSGRSFDAMVIHEGFSYRIYESVLKYERDVGEIRNVFIDEGQFFDNGLPSVVRMLATGGRNVYVSCLDKDYLGNPFRVVGELMCIADHVVKKNAGRCAECGSRAACYSMRTVDSADIVKIGGGDIYRPVCAECWVSMKGGR